MLVAGCRKAKYRNKPCIFSLLSGGQKQLGRHMMTNSVIACGHPSGQRIQREMDGNNSCDQQKEWDRVCHDMHACFQFFIFAGPLLRLCCVFYVHTFELTVSCWLWTNTIIVILVMFVLFECVYVCISFHFTIKKLYVLYYFRMSQPGSEKCYT